MTTRKLVYSALFVALGILVPQVFHMIGGTGIGQIFLPMHYPTIIGGMLLGPLSGAIIGVISVIVGMMMGMPPFMIGIFMVFELLTYGIVAGWTYYKMKMNVYVSLVITMLTGRIISVVTINIGLKLFSITLPPIFGSLGMFAVSIPGMITQLVLIPILLISLNQGLKNQRSLRND